MNKATAVLAALLAWPTCADAAELGEAYQDAARQSAAARTRLRAAEGGGIPAEYQTPQAPAKDKVAGRTFCHESSLPEDDNLTYCTNEPEFHRFKLNNYGSPRINPVAGGVHRDYEFYSVQNARQETGLTIYEWGTTDPGAADSAWSMMTEIVFFPRKVTPSVKLVRGRTAYEVTLPTGEKAVFDARTKEVLDGVLVETAPIDMSPDRFTRKFARLRYTGAGIMVRSDQRGESPRSAEVWGQRLAATIVWGNKTCKVSPADIWQQDAQDGGGVGLYPDDAAFYTMLRAKCGWSVSGL